MFRRYLPLVALTLGLTLLSACDTAEERAEKHYQKGMELLEEGDVARALVEFRNVFKLNGFHKEARLAYARVEEERGNTQAAYGQYLRLVEQYSDNLEGRRALARIAASLNNWEEVDRHVTVAEELAPGDPVVMAARAALDYRNALRDRNMEEAGLAVQASEALLAAHPDLETPRRVVIDDLLRRQDWGRALEVIDGGLERTPGDKTLITQRLAALEQLGLDDEIETQLRAMEDRFPEVEVHKTLVGWYLSRGRVADAEAYLRERVARDPENSDTQLELIGFLARQQGMDAARAEAGRIIETTTENRALYRSVRAGLDFDSGQHEVAILEMEDILKDAEPSEQTNQIKVTLARMLFATGDSVAARALVEAVLKEDTTQVSALKLKAGWLIDDDRTGDALVELRQALDQEPRDPETLTLMARAHERAGNRELMGEMLALAVEASDNAPVESMRYVQFLMQDEKLLPAEDVLKAALRLQNTNPALLNALGNVYIRLEDWMRAQDVIAALERIGTEETRGLANELTARKLAGQDRAGELTAFLGQLAEGDADLRAEAALIRLRLAQGDVEGALDYTSKLLADDPDNPTLRFIDATIMVVDGRPDEARKMYRALLAEYPKSERVWLALYRLHRSRGEVEAARAVLDEAMAELPDNGTLRWALAVEVQQQGDIEGAIAIYEEMYAANSNSLIVANNLASLISSYREGDENLQRAYTIARRLRGSSVPAFQDTYGWIAERLGNHQEALDHLEPAAAGLQADPSVQYHLAVTYVSLGRSEDALTYFRKAAELAAGMEPRQPFMDHVEAEIARLEAGGDAAVTEQN